ncbi:MAG: recombinase family protein [Fidelibacterota bacterium]|nr:MAG: recombinase family protein [Candidatus Neomarinimicrobiota bacterium]
MDLEAKDALLDRLKDGRYRNFRSMGKPGGPGKGTTGVAPFGYYWDDDQLMIDDEKVAWVRRIYRLRADGLSLRRIVRVLDESGVRTNRGNRFSPQAVLNILNNSFYQGAVVYGDLVIEGHHVSII